MFFFGDTIETHRFPTLPTEQLSLLSTFYNKGNIETVEMATELKKLEKQSEQLKEEQDREVIKTSAAIKEMVNYMREHKDPCDGDSTNPYIAKPSKNNCNCIIS